jgi:signal transduction histidine kinase
MPQGGRVIIKLAHDAEANTVDMIVRDNGCGMSPDVMRRIFDPFYTTKKGPDASGKGGTGLGLSMCREILEAHHGRIRVDSTPGKGTAFTLKLPIAHETPVVAHDATTTSDMTGPLSSATLSSASLTSVPPAPAS